MFSSLIIPQCRCSLLDHLCQTLQWSGPHRRCLDPWGLKLEPQLQCPCSDHLPLTPIVLSPTRWPHLRSLRSDLHLLGPHSHPHNRNSNLRTLILAIITAACLQTALKTDWSLKTERWSTHQISMLLKTLTKLRVTIFCSKLRPINSPLSTRVTPPRNLKL